LIVWQSSIEELKDQQDDEDNVATLGLDTSAVNDDNDEDDDDPFFQHDGSAAHTHVLVLNLISVWF